MRSGQPANTIPSNFIVPWAGRILGAIRSVRPTPSIGRVAVASAPNCAPNPAAAWRNAWVETKAGAIAGLAGAAGRASTRPPPRARLGATKAPRGELAEKRG